MAIEIMRVRKRADRTDPAPRVAGRHPVTGEKTLLHAETGQVLPWPVATIEFVGGPPAHTKVGMQWALKAEAEGR